MPRLGFCCQFMNKPELKMRTTTFKSLVDKSYEEKRQKLLEIGTHNFEVLLRQIQEIIQYPEPIRCFRISSDILPLFTHERISAIYEDILPELPDISSIGQYSIENGIRLGFHPGQMTSLCSESALNIERSIADLKYHAMIVELMKITDNNFSINIHGNNNIDPGLDRFKDNIPYLSNSIRKYLTIENDEFSCGLQNIMDSGIFHEIPVIIDFHHHWIHSKGDYIAPDNPFVDMSKYSWSNRTPLSHISMSEPEQISLSNGMPDYNESIIHSNRVKLRKHSFDFWTREFIDYIKDHLAWTDIELEAKGKDIAAIGVVANH